ncbi:MAG TPA: ATP-binding cassette domain-containing protein [Bacteroidota bacterium]|nr:ATP-binding cassette domain-containing protein [Bacteroidota bacterium]
MKQEPAAQGDQVIEIRHLKKTFESLEVLKDISIDVAQGENVAVLGKSGAGKSVLIKCIVGLLEPDEGTILLFGSDIALVGKRELAALRKRIGFLFQGAALYDSMSVRENLEFPLRRAKPKPSAEEKESMVREALANVGLSDAIEKMPSELSGGMRKRLGLARTLIQKPDIMLYDEPTTGLDPITSREISNLILEVQKTNNTSSIIITHDIECTKITSNRIVVINDGLCIAEGTFEELEQSTDEWVRSFFTWQTAGHGNGAGAQNST